MNASSGIVSKHVRAGAIAALVLACALALAFAPRAYAATADGAADMAAAKAADSTLSLETQASAAVSKYGLLTKSGVLCPCNSKGKKLALRWKYSSTKSPNKISKLFIASDVKKVPEQVRYGIVFSGGSKSTYTMNIGYRDTLKSVTFLLKNKKNACKTIAGKAFSSLSKLKTVKNFEKTKVTKIGDYAFSSCPIKTISLPKTLKSMGDYAFQNCKNLKTVKGLNKTALKSVPKDAFYNCFALTSIVLPKSCKTVKDYAFYGCGKATKLTLGSKTTSLGNSAFSGCASLKSVTLPKSVKAIGSSCFANCTDLTKLTMKSTTMVVNVDNKSYSMSGVLYGTPIYNEKAGAYVYVPASTLSSYRSDDYSAPWWYLQEADRFRAI